MERMQAFRSGEGQKINVGKIPGMDLIKPKKIVDGA